MTRNQPEHEKLLVSSSSRPNNIVMSSVFFAVGAFLLGSFLWNYFSRGKTEGAFFDLFISAAAFFMMRYQKLIYLAPAGIVRESSTWVTHSSEVVAWKDLSSVTIMTKKNESLAFFDKGTLSVKVSFKKAQIGELKNILQKYAPEIGIREIER